MSHGGRTSRAVVWGPPALAALLALPFILRQNAWFEWANGLWLLQSQVEHVRSSGLPSYFLHAPGQVYYPHHLFYAGPLLGMLAYPAVLVGAWPVFAASTAAAFAALCGGVARAARVLGVPGWWSAAPGVLFAASPYLVSDLYGRGAWTELVALGATAMALSSALALARDSGSPGRESALLVVSCAIVAAAHNLTLACAALLVPVMVVVAAGVPRPRMLLLIAGSAILGLGLCGAFLVPNLRYSGNTLISTESFNGVYFGRLADFHRPGVLLNPLPVAPSGVDGTDLRSQPSVLGLLWLLAAVAVLGLRRSLLRADALRIAALLTFAVALLVLILNPGWWPHFPREAQTVQFPFRLVPYVGLGACLALALVLREPRARTRLAALTLAAVVVLQAGLGTWQALSAEPRAQPGDPPLRVDDVTAAVPPPSFDGPGYAQPKQFKFVTGREQSRPPRSVALPDRLTDPPRRMTLRGSAPAGELVATNVVFSPLVRIDGGARVVARDPTGYAVLLVERTVGGRWSAEVRPARPRVVVAGRTLSAVAALVATGLLVAGLRRRRAPARTARTLPSHGHAS